MLRTWTSRSFKAQEMSTIPPIWLLQIGSIWSLFGRFYSCFYEIVLPCTVPFVINPGLCNETICEDVRKAWKVSKAQAEIRASWKVRHFDDDNYHVSSWVACGNRAQGKYSNTTLLSAKQNRNWNKAGVAKREGNFKQGSYFGHLYDSLNNRV